MKTILVDAVDCFVDETGKIFSELQELLDAYPHKKIILTNANEEQKEKFGLLNVPYELFTLNHNPDKVDPKYYSLMLAHFGFNIEEIIYFEHDADAVKSASSVGILTYHYDQDNKDLVALKEFLDENL